jgi:hypothetical protein
VHDSEGTGRPLCGLPSPYVHLTKS